MKRIGAIICSILVVCLVLSGCGGGSSHSNSQNSGNKTLTSITVTSSAATSVAAGATLQLAAHGNYSDGTVADITSKVAWSTSNATLATASAAGLLTTLKQGSVMVTATEGAVNGTLAIQVTQAALSTISVTGSGSLSAGSSEQLGALGTYTDGSKQTITTQVTWQSSDATVATVGGSGMMQGLKAGSITITAAMGTVSGTMNVTVTAPVLTAIRVNAPYASLGLNATEQLTAMGVYSDQTTQDLTTQVTWQSSNSTVASVSGTGALSALKTGTVTVTATMGSVIGAINVTVTSVSLTAITVGTPYGSLAANTSEQLTATGVYSDTTTQNLTTEVSWRSSDPTIATVSGSGLLTAVKAGTITVTATLNSVTGSANVTVTSVSLTAITVGTPSPSLASGLTEQLTATGVFSDSSTQDLTTQVNWQSSDATTASVSGAGLLSAIKAGTVTITATMNSVSGVANVTVTAPALNTINIGVPSPSLAAGSTEQLTATGVYSDKSTQNLTSQVVWQSSDNATGSLSATGLLTGLKAGTITATATMGAISGTATVTINAPTLSSIAVGPASFTVASGQSKQLSVQGVYSDGTSQDVTNQVTWSSGTTSAATVSSSGLVTGVSVGTSTITATLGSKTGTALVTVTAALLNKIVVTPATASIATGQTQNFLANGIFSDGSSTDITNSVTWSSSAMNFATVDQTGLATGVSAGAATITATSGSVSGTAALTVTPAVLTELDISPDPQTIPVGGQLQLSLIGTYSDNTTQTIAVAAWSSSDPTLASIDPNLGIVTGVANSNNNPVTITATYGGFTSTTTVYVTDAVPESIQLTPATASIASGTTQQYSVNVVYSDGSLQPVTAGLSWLSSTASVAGIDETGLATGLTAGQTTITVVYNSMSATASLTVTPAVLTSLVVTPITTVVGINGNVQYTATGVFTDNSTQDLTSQVLWTSSNGASATISASGLATGVTAGTVQITATSGAVSGSATLNVTTATLVSIQITPQNPVVPPHSKIQLTAIGIFSDNSQLVLSGVSWHTNSARYGMVNGNGVLRTKKATTKPVTVYATLNGITGTTGVNITSMTIQTLAVQPATPTIAAGTQQQFSLIGTFSDGVTQVDLTASARWQTSNYADAIINRQGVVTGAEPGTVTITGTVNGQTPATATLTVSNATIQSITLTPADPTIALGSSQQFAASGLFSDGSTQDVSSVVTWTSSTPTVAVVNQNGVAASATHGQTNINATFNGVTGFTLLNVN